jgi:hypothetical protein
MDLDVYKMYVSGAREITSGIRTLCRGDNDKGRECRREHVQVHARLSSESARASPAPILLAYVT